MLQIKYKAAIINNDLRVIMFYTIRVIMFYKLPHKNFNSLAVQLPIEDGAWPYGPEYILLFI